MKIKILDLFMRKSGVIIGEFIDEMSTANMNKVRDYSYNHTFKIKNQLERLGFIQRVEITANFRLTPKGINIHNHLKEIIEKVGVTNENN